MRDQIDSTREVSPLKMATDAVLLDNSTLTMDQQLEIAMQLIQEKLK
jgi:cytidylate kinase